MKQYKATKQEEKELSKKLFKRFIIVMIVWGVLFGISILISR